MKAVWPQVYTYLSRPQNPSSIAWDSTSASGVFDVLDEVGMDREWLKQPRMIGAERDSVQFGSAS